MAAALEGKALLVRRLLIAVLVFVTLAGPATVAGAQTTTVVDEAAAALRQDNVYVDPAAERALSASEADDLRTAVRAADTPTYVAVLPASALTQEGGSADAVLQALVEAVGRRGTYAVIVGDSFRAASSVLDEGEAGRLATAAFAAQRAEGPAAVLEDFVTQVGDAANGTGSGGSGGGSDGGGTNLLPVLLVGGAGAAGVLAWRSSRKRRAVAAEARREQEADRQVLQAELSVLADDVTRLEPEVRLHPEAQSDFDAATHRYRAAQAALEYADEPVDLVRVERVVNEARYSMDRARARIEGREPPPPPDDLTQPGRHGEPAVSLDDEREPVYVGYPGGYGGGWFGGGGGGGLFTGLLLGSMLGGFGGWGWGGHTTIINNPGDGGGDFGGGDFGGGDFGGGDFGGGDFGGGDF